MAHRTCDICHTRRVDPSNGCDLCGPCYDYAGWENTHSDFGHDPEAGIDVDPECWICHPELDRSAATPRTGHTNTVAKTHTSHADHKHPRTPAARAKCRASMKATGKPYTV